MSTPNTPERPTVLDTMTETQLKELEFQAEEYDEKEFLEIGATYGWDADTVQSVWDWFEVQNNYPLENTLESDEDA